MNKASSTISYYNENADSYALLSYYADMSHEYERFLRFLTPGDSIADIGCGSGRDLKYFSEHGYISYGIDASEKLCSISKAYSGCKVENCTIAEWNPDMSYSAFWASASLLHLREDEILSFFSEKSVFLKANGIIYFSMKEGIREGLDERMRYFTPYRDELLQSILDTKKFELKDIWTSEDALGRTAFKWKSIILQKNR